MQNDQGKKIAELLKQLQSAGAKVRDVSGSDQSTLGELKKKSELVEDAINSIGSKSADFEAWISWSKSF